jgi:rhodanese-related sulfurtransferase
MIKSISPVEAKKMIEKNKVTKLIDVRENWEHNLVKLENSILIPLREFPSYIKKFSVDDSFLVYCHHGTRSFLACALMLQQGFENVYNLEGGINAWSIELDKSLKKY